MSQDAQIIIEKESGIVPKDTEYLFPFSITPPNYGDSDITRNAIVAENELGSGRAFTLNIEKKHFNIVSSVTMTKLDKYLILDGQYIRTIGDKTLDVVAVGIPTEQHFTNSGFNDNIFVGKKEMDVSMQSQGFVGGYKMFSIGIPDYFTDINKIKIKS